MDVFFLVMAFILVVSLALPRAWLHGLGLLGCAGLLWHAVDIQDMPFVIVQIACLITHIIGMVAYGLRRKLTNLKLANLSRAEMARLSNNDSQDGCPTIGARNAQKGR